MSPPQSYTPLFPSTRPPPVVAKERRSLKAKLVQDESYIFADIFTFPGLQSNDSVLALYSHCANVPLRNYSFTPYKVLGYFWCRIFKDRQLAALKPWQRRLHCQKISSEPRPVLLIVSKHTRRTTRLLTSSAGRHFDSSGRWCSDCLRLLAPDLVLPLPTTTRTTWFHGHKLCLLIQSVIYREVYFWQHDDTKWCPCLHSRQRKWSHDLCLLWPWSERTS